MGLLGRGLLESGLRLLGQVLGCGGRLLVSLLLGLDLRRHLGRLLHVGGQDETSLLLGLGDIQGHSLRLDLRLLLGRSHLRNLGLLNKGLRSCSSLGQSGLPSRCLLDFTLLVPPEFVGILALLLFNVFLNASFNVLLQLTALPDSQHVQLELKDLS